MNTFYFSVSLLAVSALFFVIGYYAGKRQPGKTVFIGDWPDGSIQWDSTMRQADVLAFLDKVRAFVLANPFAKPDGTKAPSRSDNASGPTEQADD